MGTRSSSLVLSVMLAGGCVQGPPGPAARSPGPIGPGPSAADPLRDHLPPGLASTRFTEASVVGDGAALRADLSGGGAGGALRPRRRRAPGRRRRAAPRPPAPRLGPRRAARARGAGGARTRRVPHPRRGPRLRAARRVPAPWPHRVVGGAGVGAGVGLDGRRPPVPGRRAGPGGGAGRRGAAGRLGGGAAPHRRPGRAVGAVGAEGLGRRWRRPARVDDRHCRRRRGPRAGPGRALARRGRPGARHRQHDPARRPHR